MLPHRTPRHNNSTLIRTPQLLALALLFALIGTACDSVPLRKSDEELGLNETQAAGRRIYDRQCGMCHEAYSSRSLKGPSLQGVFKRPYLKMGAPANEERVREIIVVGRAKMPAFGHVLSQEQIEKLLAYMHTL